MTFKPARLTWETGSALSPEQRELLMGPGSKFEMVTQDVLGVPTQVFNQRHHSIRDLIVSSAQRFESRPLIVAADTRASNYSYAEVCRLVGHVANRLANEYGIGAGDRVAIAAANSPEYAIAFWAAASLGAIYVGLNGWWSGDELQYGIALTAPELILADSTRAARLHETLGSDSQLIPLDSILDGLPTGPSEMPTHPIAEDDPLLVLFTSGTTGRPKGAVLSHRNFLHFSQAVGLAGAAGAALAGLTPDPSVQFGSLIVSPFFHLSGIIPLINSVDGGVKVVLPGAGRWDAQTHLALTAKHRLQTWSGVPTQYWRILQHPDFANYDLSSLRSAGSGGANFAPELVRLLHEKLPGISIGNGYGMTETTGMGSITGGPMFLAFPESVGKASATSEIEIRGLDNEVLPEGEIGEIFIRHASVFLGYWDNPAATSAALSADRWYRTGDFGRVEDGMLYLESRMRDLIIRGGENIYPPEIENRLIAHPDVADVAVIGMPHLVLGEEVMAVVVRRQGSLLSAEDVQHWARMTLGAYKVPTYVTFRADLPYTQTGKVMKHQLEQEYHPR